MYEYKVVNTSLKEAERVMNEWAREGWRVVSTVNSYGLQLATRFTITFEREKKQSAKAKESGLN